MNRQEFLQLETILTSEQRVIASAVIGWCRIWTKEAISVVKKYREETGLQFKIEAREVEIEPFLFHTYLRLLTTTEAYVCDGTGTASYKPFFGLETEAAHLLPSTVDPIQYYLLSDEVDLNEGF
jgi:hypothetical protein